MNVKVEILLLQTPIEAVTRRWSVKKAFLGISQNSQENTCARVFFFFIKKETLTQVFSYEFYKFSKKPFLAEQLLVVASAPKIVYVAKMLATESFIKLL